MIVFIVVCIGLLLVVWQRWGDTLAPFLGFLVKSAHRQPSHDYDAYVKDVGRTTHHPDPSIKLARLMAAQRWLVEKGGGSVMNEKGLEEADGFLTRRIRAYRSHLQDEMDAATIV